MVYCGRQTRGSSRHDPPRSLSQWKSPLQSCLFPPSLNFKVVWQDKTFSEDSLISIALSDHLNLFFVVRRKIRMKDIMHPKTGIDIRQLLDKFPYIIELCLAIYKTEELAANLLFLPKGQMSLD